MYAIIDYKGQQILIEEGKKIKFPYLKDLKPGKTIEFDESKNLAISSGLSVSIALSKSLSTCEPELIHKLFVIST